MNYDLSRFEKAHRADYQTALSEIKSGRKRSHWMWYIFPQVIGLGRSSTSEYYAIHDIGEAKAFLDDDYLGSNLVEICNALLALDSDNATEIFGKLDDMKLKSSMTLFACASETEHSIFTDVLNKFFDGKPDRRTMQILGL